MQNSCCLALSTDLTTFQGVYRSKTTPIGQDRKFKARLLPKKILKGPSELNAENLGAQHMK